MSRLRYIKRIRKIRIKRSSPCDITIAQVKELNPVPLWIECVLACMNLTVFVEYKDPAQQSRLQWQVNLELMTVFCPVCGTEHDTDDHLPKKCPKCRTRLYGADLIIGSGDTLT